jgi:predicted DNA-binding transcriptional regulator AlpA
VINDIVGTSEIADLLGVSRQRVHQLMRTRGFPPAVALLAAGWVWAADDIVEWQLRHRPLAPGGAGSSPAVPARDRAHPRDDPWDADALRYLLTREEGRQWSRRELAECLRGQRDAAKRKPHRTRIAFALANQYGVRCHVDPGGTTLHLFRTDRRAPRPYRASAAQRRAWLKAERVRAVHERPDRGEVSARR